ncbi:MAG: hypothetical protein ACKVWV_14385 [Planctomycetota bacterium]
MLRSIGSSVFASVSLSAIAAAQVLVHEVTGPSVGAGLGFAVAGIGDVSGDGVPDFIAGAPGDFVNGSQPGKALVYSGFNGALLYSVTGQTATDGFGLCVARLGDIDGDGRPDFIVGAPYSDVSGLDAGSAYVFSGATGTLVHAVHGSAPGDAFGWSVTGLSFDPGSTPDFAVGAPLADAPLHDSGRATVYSGATGLALGSYTSGSALDQLGYAMTCVHYAPHAADLLIVSAPFANSNGVRSGSVNVRGFLPVASFDIQGPAYHTLFGKSVVVAQHQTNQSAARIYVHSLSGNATATVSLVAPLGSGVQCEDLYPGLTAISSAGDVSGSGDEELVYSQNGIVRLSSGTGCPSSFPLSSVSGSSSFGFAVGSVGDLNGDGKSEFIVGEPGGGTDGRGKVKVYTAGFTQAAPYCTAKQNSLGCTPSIASSGVPSLSIGDNFVVSAKQVLNNRVGMLVWSLHQTSLPFGGGTLCVGPLVQRTPLQLSGGNVGVDDCSGAYGFHFSHAYMNAAAWFPGLQVHAQYYSRDGGFAPPNNLGLTAGLRFTVIP